MRSEKGVTMLVLIVTIVLLIIIAGIVISATSGENGVVQEASDASFVQKVNQIMEMIEEKEAVYTLEGITSTNYLQASEKQTILGEFYSSDAKERKMDIRCEYYNSEMKMILQYKEDAFSKEQVKILKENGAEKM